MKPRLSLPLDLYVSHETLSIALCDLSLLFPKSQHLPLHRHHAGFTASSPPESGLDFRSNFFEARSDILQQRRPPTRLTASFSDLHAPCRRLLCPRTAITRQRVDLLCLCVASADDAVLRVWSYFPVFFCFGLLVSLGISFSAGCSSSPYFSAGSLAVQWFPTCCSSCVAFGGSPTGTLPLLTALRGGIGSLDGPGHLVNPFPMVLVIYALFVGCFGTTVWVARPFLFLLM